jgi:hypothetical protein
MIFDIITFEWGALLRRHRKAATTRITQATGMPSTTRPAFQSALQTPDIRKIPPECCP